MGDPPSGKQQINWFPMGNSPWKYLSKHLEITWLSTLETPNYQGIMHVENKAKPWFPSFIIVCLIGIYAGDNKAKPCYHPL